MSEEQREVCAVQWATPALSKRIRAMGSLFPFHVSVTETGLNGFPFIEVMLRAGKQ